jgi:hypothetical protein
MKLFLTVSVFIVICFAPKTAAKYEEIGKSCRRQLEFFSNGLKIQGGWALKCG